MTHGKIPLGLLLIGTMKLVVAALLSAASFGMFKLLHKDVSETLEQAIILLHLDPKNHIINPVLEKISGLDEHQLRHIGAGTMLYALLYVIEGVGLLKGKHWAEYMVIIITGSLLPLEMYEIAQKLTGLRVGVLAINVAVLLYLAYRLRRDAKAKKNNSVS